MEDKKLTDATIEDDGEELASVRAEDRGEEKKPEKKSGLPRSECPVCKTLVYEKTDVCPKCGFKGYLPMAPARINVVRTVLFFVFAAIAVVVFVLVKSK